MQNMGVILLCKVVLLVRTLLATRKIKYKSNQLGKKEKKEEIYLACVIGALFLGVRRL